jgi:hypothetical protein
MIMRKIISLKQWVLFTLSALPLFVLISCKTRTDSKIFYPSWGIKSYVVKMKKDTIEITENNFDEKFSCVMTFYRKGGDYFTNHVGQEELVMSNHQVIDTAYVYLKNYHVRRVRIERVNDTLFSTSIYTKIILEGLTLRLLYDKNYKIKKIQTYTVVKNYSPQSP